jgi:hypothetical protein
LEDKEFWQRKALIQSIASSGKTIGDPNALFGGTNVKLLAYWPEEDEWYEAEPMADDATALPLHVLASHAQFTLPGEYCAILYEDGERHLSPLYYIKSMQHQWNRCC